MNTRTPSEIKLPHHIVTTLKELDQKNSDKKLILTSESLQILHFNQIKLLVSAIEKKSFLNTISLTNINKRISDNELVVLAKLLNDAKNLVLEGDSIGNQTAVAIAKKIQSHYVHTILTSERKQDRTISSLKIVGLGITDEGLLALVGALAQYKALEKFDITCSENTSPKALLKVPHLVKNNFSIRHYNVHGFIRSNQDEPSIVDLVNKMLIAIVKRNIALTQLTKISSNFLKENITMNFVKEWNGLTLKQFNDWREKGLYSEISLDELQIQYSVPASLKDLCMAAVNKFLLFNENKNENKQTNISIEDLNKLPEDLHIEMNNYMENNNRVNLK